MKLKSANSRSNTETSVRAAKSIVFFLSTMLGLLVASIMQKNEISSMHMAILMISFAVSAVISAFLIRQTHIHSTLNQRSAAQQPIFESAPSRLRFASVMGLHISKKTMETQNHKILETILSTPEVEFRPATIVLELDGRMACSDTFNRDQALANARIALLSMDHTKQIVH